MTIPQADSWVRGLSEEARETLLAAVTAGVSTESEVGKVELESHILPSVAGRLQGALIQLMNHKPPLIARGPAGARFRLTPEGAQVARLLVAPAGVGSDQELRAIERGPRRIHRGQNNREMIEYAGEVGGEFVIEEHQRCSHPDCGHINSRFVRRGGILLCQDCFWKGRRFNGPR